MTRSDIQFTRVAPLSDALKAKTEDTGAPALSEKEGHSLLHRKTTRIVSAWASHRHSSQGSSRSSSRLTDSKDSLQSTALTVSGASPSEAKPRVSMSSGAATPDPSSTEKTRMSDSNRWSNLSALDTTSSPEALHHAPQKTKGTKAKVHIKPLLRKLSRDDAPSTSIDLSRSVNSHEGLGIYINLERDRRLGDYFTKGTGQRGVSGLHHRSTSSTSQFSSATTSSVSKPGSQYIHPMRQMPRPHTPPLTQSCRNSEDGSEDSTERTRLSSDADFLARSNLETSHTFMSEIPAPAPRLSLHIRDSSFARLPEPSQMNVTGKAPVLTHETISPLSRPSLDFSFRSKTRTNTDPLSRAATVQAARQAFEEKEAAKTRKFEKQQMKAQERELRRREKKQRHASEGNVTEKSSPPEGLDYSFPPASTPGERQRSGMMPPLGSQSESRSWKSSLKNTWMLFLTWLRTRLFKLSRRVRKSC